MSSQPVHAAPPEAGYSFADGIRAALAEWNDRDLDASTDVAVLMAFADRWRQDATLVAIRAERRADELRTRRRHDDARWAAAEAANTVEAYLSYLAQEPEGAHRQAANDRLFDLDEQHAWVVSETRGDHAALQRFLAVWPQGERAADARRRLTGAAVGPQSSTRSVRRARRNVAAWTGVVTAVAAIGGGLALVLARADNDASIAPIAMSGAPAVVHGSVAAAMKAREIEAAPTAPTVKAASNAPTVPPAEASLAVADPTSPPTEPQPAHAARDAAVSNLHGARAIAEAFAGRPSTAVAEAEPAPAPVALTDPFPARGITSAPDAPFDLSMKQPSTVARTFATPVSPRSSGEALAAVTSAPPPEVVASAPPLSPSGTTPDGASIVVGPSLTEVALGDPASSPALSSPTTAPATPAPRSSAPLADAIVSPTYQAMPQRLPATQPPSEPTTPSAATSQPPALLSPPVRVHRADFDAGWNRLSSTAAALGEPAQGPEALGAEPLSRSSLGPADLRRSLLGGHRHLAGKVLRASARIAGWAAHLAPVKPATSGGTASFAASLFAPLLGPQAVQGASTASSPKSRPAPAAARAATRLAWRSRASATRAAASAAKIAQRGWIGEFVARNHF